MANPTYNKQDAKHWAKERQRVWEFGIGNGKIEKTKKKSRFNWRKFFLFISVYFGYIIISSLVYKHAHFLFWGMFSFASLGANLWLMGIKPGDYWLNHFLEDKE